MSRERWAHTSTLLAVLWNQWAKNPKTPDHFNPYAAIGPTKPVEPEHKLEPREFVEILAHQWKAKQV